VAYPMHHTQHTRSARSPWLGSLLGLSTLSLLLGGISCSSDPGGEDGTIPPGTVVDSCPAGYACETNHDGSLVVVGSGGGSSGGASGVGGATGSTGGATGTTGGATSSGGAVGSGGAMEDPCTDIQHPDHTDKPCSEVAGWGECDSDWMQGYCDTTCGRCTPSNSG